MDQWQPEYSRQQFLRRPHRVHWWRSGWLQFPGRPSSAWRRGRIRRRDLQPSHTSVPDARLGEPTLDEHSGGPRWPRGGSLATLRKGRRRLGTQQRDIEFPRGQLERVKHKLGLACRSGPRIRLQIALDAQARIRFSFAGKLDVADGAFDTVEPRCPDGQSRYQLQV